ncbi:hypothetical protein ACHAWO_012155 [Cyclotella atomus]|jgi:vacuolar protein sorting-associated protein IST1|uniref:IST1 homolog n=1 Tax=Cyclotella atomus TaxID=382360 RepID=A0ABD3NJD1_9STRA
MPLFPGYSQTKLKPQLKMAITRLQISNNKKSALMKQQIREIAKLLAETPPKEEKARIKAESLIRDDNTIEACEILSLSCELLAERLSLISHSKTCPEDLVSTISTLLWASYIVDIPELVEVRKQFRYKYGKQFESDALQNVGGVINERVAVKLSVQPPSAYMVQTYLEKIADEHEVKWKPKKALTAEKMAEPMVAPVGYSVQVGAGSGICAGEYDLGNGVSSGGDTEKRASAPPLSPPSAAASMVQPFVPASTLEEEEEVDIYIPGIASVKLENDNRGRTQSAGEDSNANADGDGEERSDNAEESYEDLAARFAKLQR